MTHMRRELLMEATKPMQGFRGKPLHAFAPRPLQGFPHNPTHGFAHSSFTTYPRSAPIQPTEYICIFAPKKAILAPQGACRTNSN